jgi:hypothetical protein
LTGAEAEGIEFDETARWLRFSRGEHELVCNFSATDVVLACEGSQLELGTATGVALQDGTLTLPPMTGALIR